MDERIDIIFGPISQISESEAKILRIKVEWISVQVKHNRTYNMLDIFYVEWSGDN